MLLLPPWTDGWGLRHHVGSWCWSRGACEATGEGAGSFGARGLALNASRSYEGSDGLRLLPSCLALQRAAHHDLIVDHLRPAPGLPLGVRVLVNSRLIELVQAVGQDLIS